MTRPLDLAMGYMDSFFGNAPLAMMESLMAEELVFDGPFQKTCTAKEYLDKLRENPPLDVSYRLEDAYENEDSACLVYMFSKPGIETRMAQTFSIAGGKICRIRLVFDTDAFT